MKSRRGVGPVVLAVMAAGLLGIVGSASAQQRFDWTQAKGTEIRFLAVRSWFTDLFKEKLPEFEKLTGIKVVLEDFPTEPYRQKIAVEMAARNRTIDLMNTGTSFEGRRFSTSGWYADLNPLIKDPTATSPEWDVGDFIESVWKAQQLGGQHVAVPLQVVTQVLFYRKDLFNAAGIKPPTTLAELEEAAKRLHRPPDVFGFVGRGRKTQSPYTWAHWLYAYGGSWLTPDGKPAVASPAGIAALTQYARLLRNYADPGVADTGPIDVQTLFAQGRAAMLLDSNAWSGIFSDPQNSKIVGKWAVVPAPPGPAGATYELWAWSISIPAFSEKKRAAWLFIQWATSKEMQRILHLRDFPMPRKSLWDDPVWKAKVDPSWHHAAMVQFQTAKVIGHPQVVAAPEVIDMVGIAINGAIAGKDPKAELEAAARKIGEILEKTEPKGR